MDDRDIITATSATEFPAGVGSSKERIEETLMGLQKENPAFWASIKTIAKESGTSDVYTRNVMSKLLEANRVEMGRRGTKVYFRLRADEEAAPETPEE